MAFIPGEGTWPGALGDLIGSALNIDTCWWLGASGPSALELVVLDWIRQWVGYPEEAAGLLVSGGSAANLTALACAREARIGVMDARAVVYMSDQTHSSLARAARALGFRPDQVRVIPTDPRARMRPDALRGAIAADRAGARLPLMVVANAGTTTAGAVDPFHELSEICRKEGIWLHADGAYGAFACLSERGREALAGMELADSITLDPHKWLYQPIELGALLVRDGSALRRGFEISPDFLKHVEAADREVNFSDLGLQLTRSCRALKLWISLRYFGLAAFRTAIDRCLDLAQHAQCRIESSSELELMSPASLGVGRFGPCRSASGQSGIQVDAVPVWVAQLGVALAPERVPGLAVAVEPGGDHHAVRRVDLFARGAAEGQADARAAGRVDVAGLERLDGRHRVEHQPHAAGDGRLGVGLVLGPVGELEAEQAVEREAPAKVLGDDAERVELWHRTAPFTWSEQS